jgi:hypothetical protein
MLGVPVPEGLHRFARVFSALSNLLAQPRLALAINLHCLNGMAEWKSAAYAAA